MQTYIRYKHPALSSRKSHPIKIPLRQMRQLRNELCAGACGSLLPVFGAPDILNYSSHLLTAADPVSGMISSQDLGPFARHSDPEPLHRLHTTVNASGLLYCTGTTYSNQVSPWPVTAMFAAAQALQSDAINYRCCPPDNALAPVALPHSCQVTCPTVSALSVRSSAYVHTVVVSSVRCCQTELSTDDKKARNYFRISRLDAAPSCYSLLPRAAMTSCQDEIT